MSPCSEQATHLGGGTVAAFVIFYCLLSWPSYSCFLLRGFNLLLNDSACNATSRFSYSSPCRVSVSLSLRISGLSFVRAPNVECPFTLVGGPICSITGVSTAACQGGALPASIRTRTGFKTNFRAGASFNLNRGGLNGARIAHKYWPANLVGEDQNSPPSCNRRWSLRSNPLRRRYRARFDFDPIGWRHRGCYRTNSLVLRCLHFRQRCNGGRRPSDLWPALRPARCLRLLLCLMRRAPLRGRTWA
jgi:hypothetical protein